MLEVHGVCFLLGLGFNDRLGYGLFGKAECFGAARRGLQCVIPINIFLDFDLHEAHMFVLMLVHRPFHIR